MKLLCLGAGLTALLLASPAIGQTPTYSVGDTVECSGMRGRIIRTEPREGWDEPFYIVRVEGAGAVYENKCLPRMMRPAAAAAVSNGVNTSPSGQKSPAQPGGGAAMAAGALCRPGAQLEAQWGIQWYEVTVRGGPNGKGECPISFDGYGKTWDNLVGKDQLRPRGGGAVTRPARPVVTSGTAQTEVEAAPPDGTYRCHKISPGGQLMSVGSLAVSSGRATFKGMPEGWTIRSISVRGVNPRGETIVAVDYRSTAGFNDRLDCVS